MRNPTRRDTLKVLLATTGSVLFAPAASYARILGANERVTVGLIGVGRMARSHLTNLVAMSDVSVAALCDVFDRNLSWGANMAPEAATETDFRRVIDRTDIQAVVVSTPDHWHAIPTVFACQAGKDVYVEKPTAVRLHESRKMVDAARANNRIVQVGTQQRSAEHFRYAAALVREGKLGRVTNVRMWNVSNDMPDGIGNPPDSDPPSGLDWDLWLGPAPSRPFNENRFGVFLGEDGAYQRWASFRWFWDYAGGMMTDWGVHLIDIVHWAMGVDAPEQVSAIGGKLCLEDNRETPDTLLATFKYPSFVCTYENRVGNGYPIDGKSYGILFYGTDATLFLDREGFQIMPEEERDVMPATAGAVGGDHRKHVAEFIECVRTREKPTCDIEIGHRSSSAAMLGNIAYRLERQIKWDAQKEQVVGDDEASAMLDFSYRAPWKL